MFASAVCCCVRLCGFSLLANLITLLHPHHTATCGSDSLTLGLSFLLYLVVGEVVVLWLRLACQLIGEKVSACHPVKVIVTRPADFTGWLTSSLELLSKRFKNFRTERLS